MQLPNNKTLNMAQSQYQPFDFGTEDERLEVVLTKPFQLLKQCITVIHCFIPICMA